jgi:hypothetical protein
VCQPIRHRGPPERGRPHQQDRSQHPAERRRPPYAGRYQPGDRQGDQPNRNGGR